MFTKKRILIFSGFVVAILLGALLWNQGLVGSSDKKLYSYIKDRPDLIELYNRAKKGEEEIAKTPDKAVLYFNVGLDWKSIAERLETNKREFYKRSLAVYEQGIKKFGQKNILFYLNGGKLAEHVEGYTKAEKYYRKAIEIAPGDESGYLYLVDLYSYKMNKPKAEVLKVFEEGMKKMMNPALLISGRATYLNRIGDYEAALKDYEQLVTIFPNHQGYKDLVVELSAKIKQ